MKIALLKLGGRITPNVDKKMQVSTGETHAVINMLKADPTNVITVFTKILPREVPVDTKRVKWLNMADAVDSVRSMNFDCCLVMNGNVNFFGGQDDFEGQLANMFIINRIKCPIAYIMCDPALTFKQCWGSVNGRSWASKYSVKDILVTRKDISYICQTFNTDYFSARVAKMKNDISGRRYIPFAFEKVVAFSTSYVKNGDVDVLPLDEREVDLAYGGTMRDGTRAQKMIDFYWGYPKDLSVEMYGKITREDFDSKKITSKKANYGDLNPPEFGPSVSYNDILLKNQKTLAHVVIGDPIYYLGDVVPHRTYESLLAGTLTIIDSELDPNRRVYGDHKELSKWLYAPNREHVVKVLRKVKRDPKLFLDLVNAARRVTEFDHDEYCREFMSAVKAAIR